MKKLILSTFFLLFMSPLFAQEGKVHDYIIIAADYSNNVLRVSWSDGTFEDYKIEEKRKYGDFTPVIRLIQEQEAKGFEFLSASSGGPGSTVKTIFILRKPKE